MSVFVADTNFFIQAHRSTYPMDVVPGFWNKTALLATEGKIVSIDKVKNELFQNEDILKQWCIANLPDNFFNDTSLVMPQYAQVVGWAFSRNTHYLPQAIAEFLDADEADAHLIAYALADPGNRIIITQETREPGRKNKIKIPDVCLALNITYRNTIEMFRALGESF